MVNCLTSGPLFIEAEDKANILRHLFYNIFNLVWDLDLNEFAYCVLSHVNLVVICSVLL